MTAPLSSDLTPFRMTPADPHRHLTAISQMVAEVFALGEQAVEEISTQYIGNSHYDGNVSRLVWDNDRLVHHWGVWDYRMRLGSVELKAAGVGAVGTVEAYRKRGLMERAARDSFMAMQDNGYDLSLLRGRHYVKFGYARAWNYETYRLKPTEIPDLALKHGYERLGLERLAEIASVYNQYYQPYSATAVRPTYRMSKAEDMCVYGWFDSEGRLAGYVRAMPTEDQKALQCVEATGDPEHGLAVLADLFKKGDGYEALTFFTLPHHHPILRKLRRGACIVENQFFEVSGWRVRIVNLHSMLVKITPLLEARLKMSQFAHWRGDLLLDAGEQRATLKIEEGRVRVTTYSPYEHVIHGGADIARLLLGSDEPDEIIQQAKMICTGKAAELAVDLFPNRHPMLSQWDEY